MQGTKRKETAFSDSHPMRSIQTWTFKVINEEDSANSRKTPCPLLCSSFNSDLICHTFAVLVATIRSSGSMSARKVPGLRTTQPGANNLGSNCVLKPATIPHSLVRVLPSRAAPRGLNTQKANTPKSEQPQTGPLEGSLAQRCKYREMMWSGPQFSWNAWQLLRRKSP